MKPLFAAIVGLALTLPSTSVAQDDDLQWYTYSGFSDFLGRDTLTTVFGIPETDASAIILDCNTNGAELRVDISVSWPTLGVEHGVDIPFFWRTSQGSATLWSRIQLEEEFEGALIWAAIDSFLLHELGTATEITYGINGHQGIPRRTQSIVANQGEAFAFTDRCQTLWDEFQGGGVVTSPLIAEFGPDITGHVWSRYTNVSANVFDTDLELSFAVPETDDVIISAQCNIGAQGPLVAMQIGADNEGFTNGDTAILRATSGGGRSVDLTGSIFGMFSEFGVSGIEIVMAPTDPAWLVIAGDPTLMFERVGGRGGFTLTGNGPSEISSFLADCDQIDDLTPDLKAD